jgi:hypothetical protein
VLKRITSAVSISVVFIVLIAVFTEAQVSREVHPPHFAKETLGETMKPWFQSRESGLFGNNSPSPRIDADGTNIEFVGHWPFSNYSEAIVVHGDFTYWAAGGGIYVMYTANPAYPSKNTEITTHGVVEDLAIYGSHLYVAAGRAGLLIVDISSPPHFDIVGSFETENNALGVDVSDGYAYVADSDVETSVYVHILDITDPTSPVIASRIEGDYYDDEFYVDVAVSGSYAYVNDAFDMLRIYDISDPATPAMVGQGSIQGYGHDVKVQGNYAYIPDGWEGFQIIDVSDPSSPSVCGNYYGTAGCGVDHIAISGNYVYMPHGACDVHIVSISDPCSPTLAGICESRWLNQSVAVDGEYVYVGGGWYGLDVFHVSVPSNPQLVGTYDIPNHAWDVEVKENYAYMAYHSGLAVFNISDATSPRLIAFAQDPERIAANVSLYGDYAFVAGEFSDGFLIYDISVPNSPGLVGTFNVGRSFRDVEISGNYAYAVAPDAWFGIIDISDPESPTLEGSTQLDGGAFGIAVSGDYACVVGYGDSDGSLRVVDISNKSNPTSVGSSEPLWADHDVVAAGNYVYVVANGQLEIYDIENPASPTLVGVSGDYYDNVCGRLGIAGIGSSLDLVGDWIYIGGEDDVRIVDVSDPASPVCLGKYEIPYTAQGVTAAGDYIYVANGICGLLILEYVPPQCLITLTSPNGGESYLEGDNHDITWTSEDASGHVKIEYSTNGGSDWETVIDDTPDDGTYFWTVPNTPSADCLVKICDAGDESCCDQSDAAFEITERGDLSITTGELPEGTGGCAYDATLTATGGFPPYTWSITDGDFPPGLDLDPESGGFSGAPDAADTYCFTIGVEDDMGGTASQEYCLIVNPYDNVKADANNDCTVNVLDAIFVVNIILDVIEPTPDQHWCADCNGPQGDCGGDESINVLDALKIVNIILQLDVCP